MAQAMSVVMRVEDGAALVIIGEEKFRPFTARKVAATLVALGVKSHQPLAERIVAASAAAEARQAELKAAAAAARPQRMVVPEGWDMSKPLPKAHYMALSYRDRQAFKAAHMATLAPQPQEATAVAQLAAEVGF